MNEQEIKQRILSKIKKTIIEHEMIRSGDSVVIGISGGPDSVCMTHALYELKDEIGINRLVAVHINHGLRGSAADADEAYAKEFAEKCGAEFRSFKADVQKYADKHSLGTEVAGRKIRYEIFDNVSREADARVIAVAHNMDDQAETVLMRIIRGTGIKGLAGISYIRGIEDNRDIFFDETADAGLSTGEDYLSETGVIEDKKRLNEKKTVIRPILDVTRSEVEAYCNVCRLKPHMDHTNLQPIYTRNKVRLKLLPMLEEDFNPEIKHALVRLARQASEDENYIYISALSELGQRWNEDERSLILDGFEDIHDAVSKRLLFMCAGRAGLVKDLNSHHIERVLSIISEGEETKEADLTKGVYVRYSYGKLWFLKRDIILGKIGERIKFPFDELDREKTAVLDAGGRTLKLKILRNEKFVEAFSGDILKLDYERLHSCNTVFIRNRAAGDRIRVRGLGGSKKVQDFMTDRKIPKHERDRIPLVIADGNVIAVGKEAAEDCEVTNTTKTVVTIEYD